MMFDYRKLIVILITSLFCETVLPTSITPNVVTVPFNKAEEFGVNISMVDGLVCGESTLIEVRVPRFQEEKKFSSANISIYEEGVLIFDIVPQFYDFPLDESKRGFSEKGFDFCVSSEVLDKLIISLSYKNGQHTTLVLKIMKISK